MRQTTPIEWLSLSESPGFGHFFLVSGANSGRYSSDRTNLLTFGRRPIAPWSSSSTGRQIVLNNYEGFSEQQRVLCDIATSIPGLQTLSDEAWECSSSVSNNVLCHDWYGISCSADNETVTAIEISSLLLTGSISRSIGNLTGLQTLDLSYNVITGSIPTTIGKLTNLESFDVYFNYMTGSLPDALINCTSLISLNFDTNSFSGTLPVHFGRLSNLEFVDFGTNAMSGTMPSSLGDLVSASIFYIYTSSFTGTIPSTVGNSSMQW
jgi:hypothetical protein